MVDNLEIPSRVVASVSVVLAAFIVWGDRLMDVFDRIRRWYSNLHRDRDGVVLELAREIGDADGNRIPVLELPSLGISVEEAALNVRRMTEILQREHGIPRVRFEARVQELAHDMLADSIENEFINGTNLDNSNPDEWEFMPSMTSPPPEQLLSTEISRSSNWRCAECLRIFSRNDMRPSKIRNVVGTRHREVEFICPHCAEVVRKKEEPQLPKVRVVRMGKIERR